MIKIQSILEDLRSYLTIKKNDLFEKCLKERLDLSLVTYYQTLDKSLEKLDYYNEKHNLSLVKKLNKGE